MLEYDSLEKTQTINIQTESAVRNIFKIWHHMGSLNLVCVVSGRNPITFVWADVLKDDRSILDQSHSTPWCLVALWVSVYDACISIALKMPSADHCSVICVGNAMSTFIWEDDFQSLLMTLVLTLHSPLFTFVAITNCKDGSCGRTTTSIVVGYQSSSDRVITNWSLVAVNCLSWCLQSSSESIIHML